MRLPFPQRIPLPAAILGATILVGLQQLQGTSFQFSFYSFFFITVATIAFNLAEGFSRPSGSYVFFYAVLGLILGLFFKAYLGEPGDSNLHSPILTMQVFCGGITAMLVAVVISRKLTLKRPLLGPLFKEKDLRNSAIGCLAFGVFLNLSTTILPHSDGTVLSAVIQLNRFLQIAVILSTLYAIKSSGGKSGVNALVILSILTTIVFGFVGFSKEAMFVPFLCWVFAACSKRLNVRLFQVALGFLLFFLMSRYLVPYSQVGRNVVAQDASFSERIKICISLLSDLGSVRQQYLEAVSTTEITDNQVSLNYYNESQGFADRLTMIGPDDALITYTARDGFTGLYVLPAQFANWVPHVLWPNKPLVFNGNALAHKIGGIVGDEDMSTGISFTPSGEAYQLAGWYGVFVVAPLIWIMVFVVFDSLCGDVRKSPWGLLCIAIFSHMAPEGMLNGAIWITWFGSVGIIFVALTSAYVMPLVGVLVAGTKSAGNVELRPTIPSGPAGRRTSRWNRADTAPPDRSGVPI